MTADSPPRRSRLDPTELSWLHPLLFAAFMPLGNYAAYVDVVSVHSVLKWILGMWALTGVALLVAAAVFGRRDGALLVSLAILCGTVPMADGTRLVVFFGLGAVGVALGWLSRRISPDAALTTTFANLAAVGLLILPVWTLLRAWAADAPLVRDGYLEALDDAVPHPPAEGLPDVWWILLDGHGRQDVLTERYGVTDDFPSWLRSRGFYVATDARSNYGQTMLSVASTLNLAPIPELLSPTMPSETRRLPLTRLLDETRVVRLFRDRGYRVVVYDSEFALARIGGADEVRSPITLTNEFDHALFGSTVLPWVVDRLTGSRATFELAIRRRNLDWAMRDLARGDRDPGPTLVLAHVVAPHPPFVYQRDGSPRSSATASLADGTDWDEAHAGTDEVYTTGYGEQVQWLDGRMRAVVDGILAASAQPPVILIQGDHGPGDKVDWESVENTDVRERLTILSAYYLPGGEDRLYPSITPVNSFRVVLSELFGADLPLVPDRSVFQLWDAPYDGIDVTDALGPHAGPGTP